MKLEIGFGERPQALDIPDRNLAGVLLPNSCPEQADEAALVRGSLQRPIGAPRLSQLAEPGQRVAIITSDITRPVPSGKILPHVLEELLAAGVQSDDITVVFALGSHRPHTADEMRGLVGEGVYRQVRCVDSDPADAVHLGRTAAGTPVDITRAVAEADLRIGVGNIEYHYFAGYSGGAKAVMPGVSTREAIQANHSRMAMPGAETGCLDGNPVRADLEEAVGLCPLHFIVNVILDEHKRIIHAVSGHFVEAHRAGCRLLDAIYRVELKAPADIVVASQGGAPKDLNLYQTQKALDNAKNAVRPGGIIILVGSCREGMGEGVFEQWMTQADRPQSLIERIQRDFQLGGHKAAAIAMTLQRAEVFLVSEMDPAFVRSLFFTPYSTAQQALSAALEQLGGDASVLVMPYAGSTLPSLPG